MLDELILDHYGQAIAMLYPHWNRTHTLILYYEITYLPVHLRERRKTKESAQKRLQQRKYILKWTAPYGDVAAYVITADAWLV